MKVAKIIFGLVFLLFLSCRHDNKTTSMKIDDIIPVKVMDLVIENSKATVHSSGYLSTDDETLLSFKNGGIISKILVKEGDAIQKGQLLAMIDPTEVRAYAAQANLAMQKAERDFERAKRLFADSVATLEQMQNAKTAYDLAKQTNQIASFNNEFIEIRAPKSGFVLKKLANVGQIIGAGMPVLMVNGAGQSDWVIKIGLSDKQWSKVKIGDSAIVSFDIYPNQKYSARIIKKAESIDPQSGTFGAEVRLSGPFQSNFAVGIFAQVVLYTSKEEKTILIPYDAVLDADEGKAFVFVVGEDMRAKKVQVELGILKKDKVEVLSGLQNYKRLIILGNAYLNEDSKIKIIP